jgi:hypothetical protein
LRSLKPQIKPNVGHRMFKKAFQQGRSERNGEAYSLSYVEPLSEARTKLEDFFNILLVGMKNRKPGAQRFGLSANFLQHRRLLSVLEDTID